jgi:hypothetical protein
MNNNRLGKVAGILSLLLTTEMYVQELVLRITTRYSFAVFIMQSLVAIVLGVVASLLHSRRWYVVVAISAITFVILILSLAG